MKKRKQSGLARGLGDSKSFTFFGEPIRFRSCFFSSLKHSCKSSPIASFLLHVDLYDVIFLVAFAYEDNDENVFFQLSFLCTSQETGDVDGILLLAKFLTGVLILRTQQGNAHHSNTTEG